MENKTSITCIFGDDPATITLRLSTQKSPIVTGLLGADYLNNEPFRLYLNSLVHNQQTNYQGWIPSGAISTILTREGAR